MAVVAIVPLARSLPAAGLVWLVGGGLFYSVGAWVFVTHRPDPFPQVFGHHAVWHLLVLAGAVCHVVLMLGFVLPG